MSFTAGQKLAASDLDQIGSTVFQFIGAKQSTASITMGTSFTDLTGTSVTFTTQYANTKVAIWGVFDVKYSNNVDIGVGGALFVGAAFVDGVSLATSGEAHFNGVECTVAQQWSTTLPLAGSHTIKLGAVRTGVGPTGTISTQATSTCWNALVFGP
jgi:hypothetical protein